MNKITFKVNNGDILTFAQEQHDGPVSLYHFNPAQASIIPAGDMVMLANLYRYVKRYDIADSFINPAGQNVEKGGAIQPAPLPVKDPEAEPESPETEPLPIWFFLYQDGDAGYHIFRRPVDEFNPDPEKREEINAVTAALGRELVAAHGGSLIAAWPAGQVVEVADIADFPLDCHD